MAPYKAFETAIVTLITKLCRVSESFDVVENLMTASVLELGEKSVSRKMHDFLPGRHSLLHVTMWKLVVSWCCGSPNDVTFRLFCVSHYHKVQVFIQPLQILISANECKISVDLSVPTNSLTNFDLIKQGFN